MQTMDYDWVSKKKLVIKLQKDQEEIWMYFTEWKSNYKLCDSNYVTF
jgi:hypothetical protein